jgi:SAM-dependent methyltransferase
MSMNRWNYKENWNQLSSGSSEEARKSISGCSDDKRWDDSGINSYEYLKRTIGVEKKDIFLEIGCGSARIGKILAKHCEHWTGVDVSGEMIKYAASELANYPNISLKEISGFDLQGLNDDSFTKVYCVVVYMHLDEWERYSYVLESHRVLKEGGKLLINNVNLCSEDGWKFFEELRKIPPSERPLYISKTSTPQELTQYMKMAGFIDIEVIEDEPPECMTVTGRKKMTHP